MGAAEREFVGEAFETNWLSTVGPNVDAFEQEMAAYLGGDRHTLAVSSGTAALHLILRCIGVGPGDDVAVSTLTFAGSAFPISYVGASPVFIDSEAISGNIDPALVAEYLRQASARGRLPKALIAVHLYGQHADIDAIAKVCAEFGVTLIEDAAESLGSTYHGRQTGTTAPFSLLSFNGNKILSTTGGGMVVASDPAAIARMRKWATQAREPAVEYLHAELGYNYRLSNVLAGIGRGQLRWLGERVAARQAIARRYAEAFADLPGVCLQPQAPWSTHTRWLSVVQLDSSLYPSRVPDLVRALDRADIEARPVWRPMHTQPLYAEAARVGGAVAESLYTNGICLPSSSSLSADEQARVVTAFRDGLSR
jgi:dTDP-4-amino-4,6-dideoxygalactose transaminase